MIKNFGRTFNFTRAELFWVLLLAVFASFFSLLPTIWAYFKTPEGFWFAGFNFFYDPWDINTYFANIRQGFNGHWLFRNPYDSSLSTPLPIYSFYLLLGHLARIFHLSIPLVYHFAAILLTTLFSCILYFFLSFFLKEKGWRLAALFLITFSGGIGWLFFPSGIYLADVSFPDATVFQTLHLPHFILNQILFLLTLIFSFQAIVFRKWRFSFLALATGLFLAFVHPYSLFVVFFVFFGYFLIRRLAQKEPPAINYFLPPLVSWGAILLFFYVLLRSTSFYTSQLTSPPPWYFWLSYGILTPLALWGALLLWQEKKEKSLFLLSWLIFHFLALYLPFSFQRLLIKGFFIILGITATLGLKKLGSLVTRPWPIYFWVLALSIFSQAFITITTLFSPAFPFSWVYLTKEEKSAFDFLLKNSSEGEITLASYKISNFLPANTSNWVYFGHEVIANVEERRKNVVGFYSGQTNFPALQFLEKEKINYVFWGPEEKNLGELDLTKAFYLEKIYQNEKVTLFKVK